MPTNVRRFEWLWWISNLIDLSSIPFSTDPEILNYGFSRTAQIEFALVVYAVVIAIQLPFFWLAVSRRKNRARWVLFIIFVAFTIGYLFSPSPPAGSRVMAVMEFISWLVEAASFIFLFTGDARPWFNRKLPQLDADVFL